MAETGERYTVARDALFPDWSAEAGVHDEGAAPMSTSISVRIEHDTRSPAEAEAESRLRAVLQRWPLDPYLYLDRVVVSEEAARSGGAHAPFLATADLRGNDEEVLATFLHAQMHVALWDMERLGDVLDAAKAAFRDVDAQPDVVLPCLIGDVRHHVVVACLELSALTALVGTDQALALMRARPGRLFRDRVLGDPVALRDFAARNDLALPVVPPGRERRGSAISLGANGPSATLATGKQYELDLAARLTALHEAHDLRPWMFSSHVVIDTGRPNVLDEEHPVLSTYFVRAPDADLVMNYIQSQAGWRARRLDIAMLEAALGDFADECRFDPQLSRARVLQISYAVVISLVAATTVLPEDDVTGAIERHPRNRAILERLRPQLTAVHDRLVTRGVPVTR